MVISLESVSFRGRRLGWRVAVAGLAAAVVSGCSLAGASEDGAVLSGATAWSDASSSAQVAALDGPRIAGQILAGDTGTGRCLDDARPSSITLKTCDGSGPQQWTLVGEQPFAIEAGGRCLGTAPSAPGSVGLYVCDGAATEQWRRDGATAVNAGSGRCLASLDGGLVGTSTCAGRLAQQWTLPSVAVDPSGLAMPVGDIPGWRQVFTDDFGQPVPLGQFPASVSGEWSGYADSRDTSGNGTYAPGQVVSVHDGIMDLYLHTEDGVHLVAAPQPIIPRATGPDGGMTYGRYEIRFSAQPVAGYKTAWLLWPDSNTWSDGEIDFPEGNLNTAFDAYLHHVGDPQVQDTYPTPDTYGHWHTAVIEWTARSVTFLLDGHVVGVSTDVTEIPHTAMHWVLQTETQLKGGAPSDSAAGHVRIDWVTVYAPRS